MIQSVVRVIFDHAIIAAQYGRVHVRRKGERTPGLRKEACDRAEGEGRFLMKGEIRGRNLERF